MSNNHLYILYNNDQMGIYSNLNRCLIEMTDYIIHDINLSYNILKKELNIITFSKLNSYTIKKIIKNSFLEINNYNFDFDNFVIKDIYDNSISIKYNNELEGLFNRNLNKIRELYNINLSLNKM